MPISEARTRANRKYDAKTYDNVSIHIRKDTCLLERFDCYCKKVNLSRRAAIEEAMEEYLANHDTST